MECSKFGQCGGCPLGGTPYQQQLESKALFVQDQLGVRATLLSPGESGLRDRIDLVWDVQPGKPPVLGLYQLNQREGRQLVDIDTCPMLSAPMEAWLKDYRQKVPPIGLGTVRLRVAPGGQRGAWLDFANVDVKALFEEVEYLKWLSNLAIVEIGQRRKRLVWKEDRPKLVDAELFPWFETYGEKNKPIPLYGVIGGFTQVGLTSNKMLVQQVVSAAQKSGSKEWVELFCGSGNFSLAIASHGLSVMAYENDELAVQALKRSKLENSIDHLQIERVDVYHQPNKIASLGSKGLLVDPPRSGLGKSLSWLGALPAGGRPKTLIYVSCFSDTFVSDAKQLAELGFKLVELCGVDQFPQSSHMEWIGSFQAESP